MLYKLYHRKKFKEYSVPIFDASTLNYPNSFIYLAHKTYNVNGWTGPHFSSVANENNFVKDEEVGFQVLNSEIKRLLIIEFFLKEEKIRNILKELR